MSTAKINISRAYVSAILALVFLCSPSHQMNWMPAISGNFPVNPNDGFTCSYKECRKPGPGPRLFQVRCQNGVNTYGCIYRGNPHGLCGNTYNGPGKAVAFYNHLAGKCGNNKPNGCNYRKLWHDNCEQAVFDRVVNNQAAAPQWCDY